MMPPNSLQQLKQWFIDCKRDLPWRVQTTPYAVWVSEVMLQQTQVAVVIPYFERWMQHFPTIQALANADLDEVIKLWEGLGYYSRARHLHAGAKTVLQDFQGILPSSELELKKIKGLGPYTIGAIRSFAFHEKTSAVDGNVIRVLARYFLIEEDISKPATVKMIRQLAEDLLPEDESWIVNEALIELGATICTRKPVCRQCPLRGTCKSYQQGATDRIPFKSAKTVVTALQRDVVIIRCRDRFLIQRIGKGKIMSDLHEFPYFESLQESNIRQQIQKAFQCDAKMEHHFSEVAHSFTRYRVKLLPTLWQSQKCPEVEGYQWLMLSELKELAFSSGHKRVLQQLSDWLRKV